MPSSRSLEASGSACRETGWLPLHVVVEAGGRLLGCAPMYLKSHSYGEYVFDWGWANAYERAGGRYYPKLQVAVPFTPVPGPRLLLAPGAGPEVRSALAQGLVGAAEQLGVSSLHVTFCQRAGVGRARGRRPAQTPGRAVSLAQPRLSELRRLPRQRSRAASARPSARSAPGSPSRA